MIVMKMRVGDKWYAGESLEENYDLKKPAQVFKPGFEPNTNREVSKLIFVNEREKARELWGARGVNSAMQKLEQRVRMGLIDNKAAINIETA